MPIVEEFSDDDEGSSDGIGFKIKNGSNKCVYVTLENNDILAPMFAQSVGPEVKLNKHFKMVFLEEEGNNTLYFGTSRSKPFGTNAGYNLILRNTWTSPNIEPEAGNIYKLCLDPGSTKPHVEIRDKVPTSAKVRTGLKKGVKGARKFFGMGEEIGNEYVGTSQFTSFSENIGGRPETPWESLSKLPRRALRLLANDTVVKVFVNGEFKLDERFSADGATFHFTYVGTEMSKRLKVRMIGGIFLVTKMSVQKNDIVYVNLTRLAKGKMDHIFDVQNRSAGAYFSSVDSENRRHERWQRKVEERDTRLSYVGEQISFMTGEDYASEISAPSSQAHAANY